MEGICPGVHRIQKDTVLPPPQNSLACTCFPSLCFASPLLADNRFQFLGDSDFLALDAIHSRSLREGPRLWLRETVPIHRASAEFIEAGFHPFQ